MTSDGVALTPPPSQQPGREKQQSPEQRKYSFQRDSNQTQRQRHQPDKRKQNQRKHRQRPAEHEQDAPTDKQNQCLHNARILSRATSDGPLQLRVGFRGNTRAHASPGSSLSSARAPVKAILVR